MKESLGVDFGNVIIDHVGFGTTPEFFQLGDYNTIPAVFGAFEALRLLNENRFRDNIFVVYNASDVADQKITSWLETHNFFDQTGISRDRVSRTQNGRNKRSLCGRYGATHFVDDRLEVLGHLIGKVENLYLFSPHHKEVERYKEFLNQVYELDSWSEIIRLLID